MTTDSLSRPESCINNVKLTLNCTKDYNKSHHRHSTDDIAYAKRSKEKPPRPKDKYVRASLENVSANPWGESPDQQSSLRRSRSLAVSKENIFYSLEYTRETNGQGRRRRRSQLIPRAKLIEKPPNRESRYRGSSVENIPLTAHHQRNRRNSDLVPPDYTPPEESYAELLRQHRKSEEIYSHISLKNYETPPARQQQDSLDSNYHNKTSINSLYRVSYEDLRELSLPHYYPEARYDTDNTTDNISFTDNISSLSLDNLSKIRYPSFDNLDLKWERNELYESIPYDENIILSTNKNLYDTPEIRPRTIRKPTPSKDNTYGHVKDKRPETPETPETHYAIEETDSNLDEINLNNEHITKEVHETSTEASQETSEIEVNESNQIKTLIEVPPSEELVTTEKSEEYKTIVSVDVTPSNEDTDQVESSCKHARKEQKTHSHNYLKEFLETQKGSKKPLQNFIAKKLSNLSRRNSKESNLTENQFHSLPDITASKNLRKCEKIDRKLRKCEKSNQLTKPAADTSKENRFIVNIGRHFDITANSSVPLDFEVKIAKIPKKNRKNSSDNKAKSDEQFLEAVKNLKATLEGGQSNLDENHNIKKSQTDLCEKFSKTENMALVSRKDECTNEFKEKLGSMRTYWDRMIGNPCKQNDEDEEKETSCKIVEVKTKIEDVKKKFEGTIEINEEKPPSKVQLTKQLFEPKTPEKVEKISPLIKESCNYFENNAYMYQNDRSFESLCPSSVEIIDKSNEKSDATKEKVNKDSKRRPGKPLSKSNSICNQPKFDHVRYKVVKSDLFQKKIFANCETESQFDGLIQYLQDYSFQELLIDNNIVIIEPIRSKVPFEPSPCVKSVKNVTAMLHRKESEAGEDKSALNRPFFYHPIRVNKEVNDDELPNPDTVRQVRQFFEGRLNKSQSTNDIQTTIKENQSKNAVDPDKDICSATDSTSASNLSDFGSQENLYDSIDNEIYCEYVSEDILEKIRECGTTVTYYGGRVVNQNSSQPALTKTIMEEIRNSERRCSECSNCKKNMKEEKESGKKDTFVGMKFRILKSNSCSSRLELMGADNLQDTKKRFISQHKKLMKQENMRRTLRQVNEKESEEEFVEQKTTVNETENTMKESKNDQPKIIAEEMKMCENKMTQWKEIKNGNSCNVNFTEKSSQKIYDYYHYDKNRKKKIDDMEFEPYEVA